MTQRQSPDSVPLARVVAISVVVSLMLLIVGGSGALFYASRGYGQGRSEIERCGGEFVDVYGYGEGGRIELGPYVSVSFAEKPLTDDRLRRITPRLPFLVRSGRLRLDLTATQITDAGLAQLRGATSLHFLELGNTQVSDAGIAHLEDCPNLEYVNLWSCPRITDESLKTLGQLPQMRCLQLGRTGVTDEGLVHLKALGKLQRLGLSGTAVTEIGVAALRQSLPGAEIDY